MSMYIFQHHLQLTQLNKESVAGNPPSSLYECVINTNNIVL